MTAPRRFLLNYFHALGDTVVMTGIVRDLKRAYGDRIELSVRSAFDRVWDHNPYLTTFDPKDKSVVSCEFHIAPYIQASKTVRLHYLTAYHRQFEEKTGVVVPVTDSIPDLHFSAEELNKPPVIGRYWLLLAGGKITDTTKHWRSLWYQEVVDRLLEHGIQCVQTGGGTHKDVHIPLQRVINLVGVGDPRDLLLQVKHAEGVICPITAAMHIAAACEKPAVVIAGGREAWWWESYTNESPSIFGPQAKLVDMPHRYLHTIGELDCCQSFGCWKRLVVPLTKEDADPRRQKKLCTYPHRFHEQPIAECMARITPEKVVDAVLSYYQQGLLPPIDKAAPPLQITPELPPAQIAPQSQQAPVELVIPKLAARSSPQFGLGKLTVCVLCYGNELDMARKCISGIQASLPGDQLDLRVAVNEAGPDVTAYLQTVPMTKLYLFAENRKKYPVMRLMFNDPDAPITTDYLAWFDDDTWVLDHRWPEQLAACIRQNEPRGAGVYGWKYYHDLTRYATASYDPRQWFRDGEWFQAREFQTRSGLATPNAEGIFFVVGWFWAAHVGAIRAAGIPDARLNHNGGDITIGAQFYQAGYTIADFNRNKSLVFTPPKSRRGYSESFPWATAPAGV